MIAYKENGRAITSFSSPYTGKDVTVAIDASKTNTAIVVGDTRFEVLDFYEISAPGSENNIWDVVDAQREALRTILKGATVHVAGIEDIITKGNAGMNEHHTRMVLTTIWTGLILVLRDEFNCKPLLVNNMTWKSAVLPEPYNSRRYDKGSLEYHKHINSRYAHCTDDVTDAVSILEYLKIQNKDKISIPIAAPVSVNKQFDYILCDLATAIPHNACRFTYNPSLPFNQNVDFMAYTLKEQIGVVEIPIEQIPLNIVAAKMYGEVKGRVSSLRVVVKCK